MCRKNKVLFEQRRRMLENCKGRKRVCDEELYDEEAFSRCIEKGWFG